MSLIENLDGPGWKDFLTRVFVTTLDVLDGDVHRWAGSSVDDLRAWLRSGGFAHARRRLDEQADLRGFPAEQRAAVLTEFEGLVVRHRRRLIRLAVQGRIAAPSATMPRIELPPGVDIDDLLARTAAGERPFDVWMCASGRSEEEIAAAYEVVDAWLATVLPAHHDAN